MLGDEMIDEASRKMALVISAKGRAAGMTRTKTFTPPRAEHPRPASLGGPVAPGGERVGYFRWKAVVILGAVRACPR